MKHVISVIFLFVSLGVHSQVPNCFDKPNFSDGSYSVEIVKKEFRSEEILGLLAKFQSGEYFEVVGYPLFFDNSIYLYLQAVDHGVGSFVLPKADFVKAFLAELTKLAKKGIELRCQGKGSIIPL
jgi:hypothetical protein